MIALIDYGAGNLASVRKALATVGGRVFTPAAPSDLTRAAGVIVPGVGHFGATTALDAAWRASIREAAERGRPLLGVCLGLQWLFEASDEAPGCAGLGLLPGRCTRLPGGTQKVPHVGWNTLTRIRPDSFVDRLGEAPHAYFTHSYAAPLTDETTAVTEYGVPFASVVERGAVWGVQFHPEKSGEAGLEILRRFMARAAA